MRIEQKIVSKDGRAISTKQLGIAGRYNLELAAGFEIFGRLGLQNQWFTADDVTDADGSGFLVGLGAEYHFKAGPIPNAHVFIDYNITHGSLTNTFGEEYDVTTRVWTAGFAAGF